MKHREGKQRVVRIANDLVGLSPVFLDTETTGISPLDVVIEIAVLDSDGSVLLDTLAKSTMPIPPEATAIHGINDIHLVDAPEWGEVWPELVRVLDGRVVGIYNAAFDLRMLRQTCGLAGILWTQPFKRHFCIMEMFAEFFGDWNQSRRSYRWKSLEFAGKYFKLPGQNVHRAKEDTILSKLVFESIAKG
jgi:DNA polymerase-3 subunit epsilon